MCSIVGSFNQNKFKQLVEMNQYRGTFSYSFNVLDKNTPIFSKKNFGEFNYNLLNESPVGYFLGHTQAPTGGLTKDPRRIHPANNGKNFLFHNGIIKEKYITVMQEYLNSGESWDTKLMFDMLEQDGFNVLNKIDGSFACVYKHQDNIYLFRSQAGTLFIDEELNISSVKFPGSKRIEADKIFKINWSKNRLEEVGVFKSISTPYFF